MPATQRKGALAIWSSSTTQLADLRLKVELPGRGETPCLARQERTDEREKTPGAADRRQARGTKAGRVQGRPVPSRSVHGQYTSPLVRQPRSTTPESPMSLLS